MCQNDPGLCEEWDADGGGNAVFSVPMKGHLEELADPGSGETLVCDYHRGKRRPLSWGATVSEVAIPDGDVPEYSDHYSVASKQTRWADLGCLGGKPPWVQRPETPSCHGCGREFLKCRLPCENGCSGATICQWGHIENGQYAFKCDGKRR